MALTDNLISYWKLDGNSNDSVGSNNGTDTSISYVGGKIKSCASFNGSSSYIRPSNTSLNITGSISVGLWVKTSSTGAYKSLFQNYSQLSNLVSGIRIGINASNFVELTLGKNTGGTINTDYKVLTGTSNVCNGNWNYVVCTFDSSTMYIYVNGVLESSVAWANATVYQADCKVTIGANNYQSALFTDYLNGQLDEIGIWSRALSEVEVKQLYNSGVALPHPFTSPIFAIWNKNDKEANVTLSNGDLTATSGTTLWRNVRATIGKSSGKWYWEIKTTAGTTETMVAIGTSAATLGGSGATFPGSDAVSYGYYGNGGNKFNNNSGVAYGAGLTTNDVVGVALDMDAGTLTFYKNGVSQGQAYSGISGTYFPMVGLDASGQAVVANFGATTFAYPVPSGFNAGIYSGTYDKNYLITGLNVYYKLDESSGNATDSVGSNTLTNANVTYSQGKINNGANFNGSTSSLLSSTKPVSIAASSECTLSCWVKLSGTGTSQFLLDVISTDNLRQITIDKNAAGTISAFLYANTIQRVSGSFSVDTTNTIWYHAVVTKNTSDLLTLYVNGTAIGNVTVTGTQNLGASGGIGVGRHSGATANYVNGSVDEVGIWQKALNALDVQNLYNNGAGLSYPFTGTTITFNPGAFLFFSK